MIEGLDGGQDFVLVVLAKLGIERKRQDLPAGLLGHRKLRMRDYKRRKRGLLVQGLRIMHERLNALLRQVILKLVATRVPNDIEVTAGFGRSRRADGNCL